LDENGRNVTLLSEIVDHKKSSTAVSIADGWDSGPGGTVDKYSANIIAEHIYSQLDEDGRNVTLLSEIVDHKKSSTAVTIADGWDSGPGGSMKPKKATIG
jgi:hypothetical protein